MEQCSKHILVVIGNHACDDKLLNRKVQGLINNSLCKLSVLLVLPKIPTSYAQIPALLNLENQLVENAKLRMTDFARCFAVPTERQWLRFGNAAQEIKRIVHSEHVDAVISVDEMPPVPTYPVRHATLKQASAVVAYR